MIDRGRTAQMLMDLVQVSHTANLEALPRLVAEHAWPVGLHDSAMFVVDVQDRVMRQITGRGLDAGQGGEELRVDGTLPGRAWQRAESVAEPGTRQGRRRWWTAITDGVERLGVLRADVAEDEQPQQALSDLASVLALLLLSKRSFSDSYARLVRSAPMNVAAEMQMNLMPPPAYAGRNVTVGAVLEPAYDLGGDAFDFALADTTLHLSVFDAMGHDTAAGITANVAVAACRNARRQGASLAETSRAVERTLLEEFGTKRYVTGILAALDVASGELTWVNRGHHLPILIRDQRTSTTLTCPPAGRWAPVSSFRSPSAANSCSPVTGSCSTPTASSKPATRPATNSARTGSSTSSCATIPATSPCTRPCAVSCVPCWTTTPDGWTTTPPSCWPSGAAGTRTTSLPDPPPDDGLVDAAGKRAAGVSAAGPDSPRRAAAPGRAVVDARPDAPGAAYPTRGGTATPAGAARPGTVHWCALPFPA